MRLPLAVLLASLLTLAVPAVAGAAEWTTYDRPAQFETVTDADVPILMSDGIVLVADVLRPDKPGRYPVILIQTPYNKNVTGGVFSGAAATYLAQRGFVVATVDVRGTGGSQGVWDSFGPNEQRDGGELVEWAARQPWSTGKVGLYGPSYMGIMQLLTAARRPRGLEAIFPIVPMADSYRDITFSGGMANVSFIPLWLGLVTGTSLVPPAYALSGNPEDLVRATTTLASHASGVAGFQLGTVVAATTGGDNAFDGPFWKTRSPLEVVDRIDVPAFVVGGHHDLFQRGEPAIYERLEQRVTARLLMGPWTHIAAGDGLPRDGVPTIESIALRWFDRYLRGIDTDIDRIPKVTQYVYGQEKYVTQRDWPDPDLEPRTMHLRAGGRITQEQPDATEASQSFLQQPLSGVCTQSTSQWTAGATEPIPCTTDNRVNEALGEAVYTTSAFERDLDLSGPVGVNLWAKTTASDAVLSVRVTDVAPDGTSTELSSGWLAASFRAVDRARTRVVRGTVLQPWHPYTRASVLPVPANTPLELPIEVFPVRATLRKGHRLRVTVGPSDFPHQLPPLPLGLRSLLGQVTILTDRAHASTIALPAVGTCEKVRKRVKLKRRSRKSKRRTRIVTSCRVLRTPDLTRSF